MKIDKPGKYVTRGGDVAEVITTNARGDYSCIGYVDECSSLYLWRPDGRYLGGYDPCDIVDVYRPMVEREGWCNIVRSAYHKDHRCVTSLAIYSTEAGAINNGKSSCKEIIAIGHITWKESVE